MPNSAEDVYRHDDGGTAAFAESLRGKIPTPDFAADIFRELASGDVDPEKLAVGRETILETWEDRDNANGSLAYIRSVVEMMAADRHTLAMIKEAARAAGSHGSLLPILGMVESLKEMDNQAGRDLVMCFMTGASVMVFLALGSMELKVTVETEPDDAGD